MSKKKLGLGMLIALVIGNMIGSGAYLLPSTLSTIGSISLYAWIFTCAGAISLALVFGRLSSVLPKKGGPYAYTKTGFGNFIGFQTSFCYWVSCWIGNCAITVACIAYLKYFFPMLAVPWISFSAAIIILWFFTLINTMGVKHVGVIQTVTVVIKLIPILVVVLLGWFFFHPHYLTESFNVTSQPHLSNISAISLAATLTLWGFIGVESATVPAGNVHNPKRNIARATILGTIIVAVIYLLSSVVVMGMIPNHVLQSTTAPFAVAAKLIFGPVGGMVIAIGAIISCLGALNGWVLLQGQIVMAAAEDGLFPFAKFFAKKNKNDVPANATIMTSCFITLLLFGTMSANLVTQFNFIILLATSIALFMYFYVSVTSLVLARVKILKSTIPHIILSLFACCYSFWAIFSAGYNLIFYELMFLLATFVIYVAVIAPSKSSLIYPDEFKGDI
jgi:basic amino acid/polyamine antiporter, APA family